MTAPGKDPNQMTVDEILAESVPTSEAKMQAALSELKRGLDLVQQGVDLLTSGRPVGRRQDA